MGSEEKNAKKEKREARSPEDAAAREAKKAAKRAKKAGGGGGGVGVDDDGRVARVRVSPVPPGSDVASIASFLGVDASKVVVLSGEATAIMPNASAAERTASSLDETKFKGRFVRVVRDDFKPIAKHAEDANNQREDTHNKNDATARQLNSSRPDRTQDNSPSRVVEVECQGQHGRIIGKGGSKIREIEELTGCTLRIKHEEGICEVSGRDVNAAVQEIKNIVEEGRKRDGGGGGGGYGQQSGANQWSALSSDFGYKNAPPPQNAFPSQTQTQALPFGMPPPGSTSRHDTGANDWVCPCGSVNFARRGMCFKCQAVRGGGGGGIATPTAAPSQPVAFAVKSHAQGTDGDGFEVFVKYLPHETTDADVSEFFQRYGQLVGDARLIRDANGKCKGAGFVTFVSETSRTEALKNDGVRFGGRHLSITVAKTGTFGVRATEQKAGTHTPAMLHETIDKLIKPDPNGVYIDGTFGRGGHSRGILSALGPNGKLHAFDMDPEAIKEGKKLQAEDERFTIHHAPFGCMDKVLRDTPSISGVFLDLGISSPQFDDSGRGFRPEQDGPLDLRFDLTRGEPASAFLRNVAREELIRIIHAFGETSDPIAARRVADGIVLARESNALPSTTKAFAALVASAKGKEYQAMHPAKLTFQALRIHLNQEFDEMRRGMRAAMEVMADGGRLGVLTWKHSECALLFDFYRAFEKARRDTPLAKWFEESHPNDAEKVFENEKSDWAIEADDALRPSEKEMRENSRSRSAILHVLRRHSNAVRTMSVERAAYKAKKWDAPPKEPTPPETTFQYDALSNDTKKDKKDSKKDKKDKKRGSKWAEV